MATDNFPPQSISKWCNCCVFLRVAIPATWDKMWFLLIHWVCNVDVTADRNGARQPAWLEWESAFIIPRDFMPSGRQNSTEKARFKWCHYSPAITLCNQHLVHNDPLQQNKKSLLLVLSRKCSGGTFWDLHFKDLYSNCTLYVNLEELMTSTMLKAAQLTS